jgi:hypothetical protein
MIMLLKPLFFIRLRKRLATAQNSLIICISYRLVLPFPFTGCKRWTTVGTDVKFLYGFLQLKCWDCSLLGFDTFRFRRLTQTFRRNIRPLSSRLMEWISSWWWYRPVSNIVVSETKQKRKNDERKYVTFVRCVSQEIKGPAGLRS